jgi:hypothetical protein
MTSGTDRPASGRFRPATLTARPLVGSPIAQAMSAGLGLVTVAAAAPTVLVDGLLHGPDAMNGSARGTALVMMVVGVPALIAGQLATRRGVRRAVPIWIGSCAYLVYNSFLLLFATPFNSLFLLYVAAFSLALWTSVAILRVVDVTDVAPPESPAGLRRAVAVFTWVLVALNAAAWLRRILPELGAPAPAFLDGTGLPTAPTYVQDLAVWLPLMAVAAFWLWRGLAWGYLVVAAMLSTWVVESITIAVDQYLGATADPAATVVSSAMTPAFGLAALVIAVPAWLLLRRM